MLIIYMTKCVRKSISKYSHGTNNSRLSLALFEWCVCADGPRHYIWPDISAPAWRYCVVIFITESVAMVALQIFICHPTLLLCTPSWLYFCNNKSVGRCTKCWFLLTIFPVFLKVISYKLVSVFDDGKSCLKFCGLRCHGSFAAGARSRLTRIGINETIIIFIKVVGHRLMWKHMDLTGASIW